MLTHMGVSVSLGATRNMVSSLRKHAQSQLNHLPPGNMVYYNFNMDFKVAQPVAGHQGMHMVATTVFFVPYVNTSLEDLWFVKELREKSIYNKDLAPDDPTLD